MSYDFFAQTQELTLQELQSKEKLPLWKSKRPDPAIEWLKRLDLLPTSQIDSVIEHLPPLSFALTLQFQLAKPYISRDETSFSIIENPVRKEWVFKVPYVAPSGWKGALRAALWQNLGKEVHETDEQVKRLFGEIRDDTTGQAGCLHLYPTFFDQVGLEVINPHDRERGIGKRGPIYFECVPAQATGRLTMLYVPIKVPARAAEVAEDLRILAEGVVAMLTTYGFGAKTSSGYGTAEDALQGVGQLVVHAALSYPGVAEKPGDTTQSETPQAPSRYQEPSGYLIAALRQDDGSLKSEADYQASVERQGKKYTKSEKTVL
ncbi:MAG: hypothetical protein HC884_03925 [Chloroflexaceae bacterium]|nr:hypothetical protein [Chloroflexaceae bacterium]